MKQPRARIKQAFVILVFSIVFTLSLLTLFSATAQAEGDPSPSEQAVQNGISWLENNQNQDGSWGTKTVIRSTSLAIEALMSASPDSNTLVNALSWLDQAEAQNNDYLSRQISALSLLGSDTSQQVEKLLGSINQDGSLGTAEGYEGDIWDTALALTALVRTQNPAAEGCMRFLWRQQNEDGSWGAASWNQENIHVTAQAVKALCDYRDSINYVLGLDSVISRGVKWLRSAQNPDGGWGNENNSLYDTLLVYQAMKASSVAPLEAGSALQYILQLQDQDGGWNGSAVETSLAVQALTGLEPDLTILEDSLVVSNDEPTEGDTINLSVGIENAGFIAAGAFDVSVFEGDPKAGGVLVSETHISSDIPPGENVFISFNIDTTGSDSWGDIKTWYYLVLDSKSLVDETRENNNTALTGVTIKPRPDFLVSSERISYYPKASRAGQSFYIRCEVENIGLSRAENVKVRFFLGDPLSGGIPIGDDINIWEMQPGSYVAATKEVSFEEGQYDIYVMIDPDGAIDERNETNNTACIDVEVLPVYNLRVNTSTTSINPDLPYEGETAELSSSIMNDSFEEIADVDVAFFDGDPLAGGELIGETSVPQLDAWSCVAAKVQWDTTGKQGIHEIFVVVDPEDEIGEASEDDNITSIEIEVGILPDLYIEETGLSLAPNIIDEGGSVDITVRIHAGPGLLRNRFSVYFLLDDPQAYSNMIGEVRELSIEPDSYIDINMTWDETIGHAGQRTIYAVADFLDRAEEIDEDNNAAQAELTINPVYTNLRLVEGSLAFSNDHPEEGEFLTIGCDVQNDSSISAPSVVVRAYDGHPDQGGTLVEERNLYISGGHTSHAGFSWQVAPGAHDIHVFVDPEDAIAEYDEQDNHSSASLFATSTTTDIAVARTEMGLSNRDPVSGEAVEVTAVVRNTRERDVEQVKVCFYEGDPGQGGALFSEAIIGSLPMGCEETLTATWESAGKIGAYDLWAVADPDDAIEEAEENNNSGYRRLVVHDACLPAPHDLCASENGSGGVHLAWACDGSPYGYQVYRNGVRISGPFDIAPEGIASASSSSDTTRSPDRANDGSPGSLWRSDSDAGLPAWLEITFPEEREIDRVAILWGMVEYGDISHDYDVQVWDGQDWQTVASILDSMEPSNVHFFDPVSTTKVRIYVTEELDFEYYPYAKNWATIYEVDIYPRSLDTPTYVDESPPQGEHHYSVVSCNLLGDESAASNYALIETFRDPVPPLAPSGLKVRYSEMNTEKDLLRVDLEWDANTEEDIAGYFIYKNGERIKGNTSCLYPPSAIPWGHLESLCNDQYGFLNLTHNNATQEYVTSTPGIITFKDFLLDSGDYIIVREKETGETIGIFSGDQGEIKIPMALYPVQDSTWIKWEFLVTSDYKNHGGDIGANLILEKEHFPDYTGSATLRWDDDWLDLSGEYVYEIAAVDKYLNEGEPARIVINALPPATPQNLREDWDESSITLKWDHNNETDLLGYNVYCYSPYLHIWDKMTSEPIPASDLPSYTEDVLPNSNWTYRVTAVDNLGIESEPAEIETGRPDLTFSAQRMSFYPLLPWTQDRIFVGISVKNEGVAEARAVKILLSDGDPAQGGIMFAETEIGAIDIGQTIPLIMECGPGINPGMHNVFITIDPDSELYEIDEGNNVASAEVEVTAEPQLMISITSVGSAVGSGYQYPPVWVAGCVVTDRFGAPVEGMGKDQFELEHNGQGMSIVDLVELPETQRGRYWIAYRRPAGWAMHSEQVNIKISAVYGDIHGEEESLMGSYTLEEKPFLTIENPQLFKTAEQNIFIEPERPQAGGASTVSVKVTNFGSYTAENVVVRLIDGDEQIEDKVIDSILPGQSIIVEFAWRVSEQDTTLTAVVDPDNAIDEGQMDHYLFHQASLDVDVIQPLIHDLAVHSSGIAFSSNPALEGEQVNAQATITNLGTVAESNVTVRFFAGDPDAGGTLIADSVVPSISIGGEGIAAAVVDTLSLPASGEVFVVADPDSTVTETDETNNIAFANLDVVSNMLEMEVLTDKDSYNHNDAATISVSVINQGTGTWDGACTLTFLDELGNIVSKVTLQDIIGLGPGMSAVREASFACEGKVAGAYTASAELHDLGTEDRAFVHEEAGFMIIPHRSVNATIYSGKRNYSCNDSVDLHCQVDGESFNLLSEGLCARFFVEDSNGVRVFENNNEFTMLYNTGLIPVEARWQMEAIPAGNYTAGVDILTGEGIMIAQGQGSFDVLSTLQEGGGLSGLLNVDPAQVEQGGNVGIGLTATNNGNASFGSIDIKLTVAPLAGDVVLEEIYSTSLDVSEEFTSSLSLDTASLPLVIRPEGDYYMVALSADVGGEDVGLDVGALRVMPALDLSVSQPVISPDPPLAESNIIISALVTNSSESAMTAEDVWVRFYLGDPQNGGIQLGEDIYIESLAPGEQASVAATSVFECGEYTVHAAVDPLALIGEFDEDNNLSSASFHVYSGPSITGTLSLDAGSYSAYEDIGISVSATNTGDLTASAVAELYVEDGTGQPVETIQPLHFNEITPGETMISNTGWNTQGTLSGEYRIHLVLREGEDTLTEQFVPFTIESMLTLGSLVSVDKQEYDICEEVAIMAQATNTSPNYEYEDLTLDLEIYDPDNNLIDAISQGSGPLPRGDTFTTPHTFNTERMPPGTYRVELVVFYGGSSLSSASCNYTVVSTQESGSGLSGTLEVNPPEIIQGEAFVTAWTVANGGNADVSDMPLQLEVVDQSSAVLWSGEGLLTVAKDGVATGSFTVSTTGFPIGGGDYSVKLAAVTADGRITLGEGGVVVAPAIDLTISQPSVSPEPALEDGDIEISAEVSNAEDVQTAAEGVLVRFYLDDPQSGGTQMGEDITIGSIAPGEISTVSVSNRLGVGDYTVYVVVDPLNAIVEKVEANNLSYRSFHVYAGSNITGALSLDKESYTASEEMVISVSATNSGDLAGNATAELFVENEQGDFLDALQPLLLTALAPDETRALEASWNTGNTPAGSYRIHLVLYEGEDVVSDQSVPFAIEWVQTATTITLADPDPLQYSDPIKVSATLLNEAGQPLSGKPVMFSLNGTTSYPISTDSSGSATWNTQVLNPAGQYTVSASFAGDHEYLASSDAAALAIEKENLSLVYTGDYLSLVDGEMVISATASEEDDGSPGQITEAGEVAFDFRDLQGNLMCSLNAVLDMQGNASATTTSLPANVYTVTTRLVENSYYQAEPVGAQMVVYDPEGGFTTGGGFLCDGGLKTFGFCIKPSTCNPWLPKGNVLFVDHSSLCNPLMIKATGFAWLVIPEGEDIAYIAGTCSLNCQDGFSFYLNVEDLGGWLSRLDTIHLVVKDASGAVVYEAQGMIDGGNIKIHRD